jgi:hypothetical protein
MHPHTTLWHYLWLAPRVFQLCIAAVMIRRKLHREFPIFFAYTVWEAIMGLTLFALDHISAVSALHYWQVYWLDFIASTALRFGMIWEVFAHVFHPYPALWEFGKMVFRWAAVVLLLVAVAVAAYSPSPEGFWILSGVYVVDRTISIIQCGLLMFLFMFSSYFGLSWRSYIFGIASGLGIYSTVQLVASSIWIQTGPFNPNTAFAFVTMATFHCCVLIWFFYLVGKEPVRRRVGEIPHNDLEVWDRELARLLHS